MFRQFISNHNYNYCEYEKLEYSIGPGDDVFSLKTKDEVIHCEPETAASGTPVGAGDILLAIYLGGGAQPNALKDAIAWSAASVPLPGTAIPTPAQAAAVGVKVNEVLTDSRELAEVH